MKSFVFLQRDLRFLGVLPCERAKYLASIGIFYGLLVSHICATFWFYLYRARTTAEQSESSFAALSLSWTLFWRIAFHFKSKEYAKLLEDLDIIIEKSDGIKFYLSFYHTRIVSNFKICIE